MKLASARLLLELGRQPYVPHPRIRYFTLSQVAIAKEVRSILLCRSQSKSHGTGIGKSVPDRGNQLEELLPGRVRGKSLHLPAGGADAPGGRAAAGHRTAGGRDRGTGGLRKSKQIRGGFCQAVRLPAAGISQKGTARLSRALFCPVSESVMPPRRSAATGRSRSGAPPCGGRGRPVPSAPPGRPAGPHGRHPAPRCGRLPPRYASCGR